MPDILLVIIATIFATLCIVFLIPAIVAWLTSDKKGFKDEFYVCQTIICALLIGKWNVIPNAPCPNCKNRLVVGEKQCKRCNSKIKWNDTTR